MLVCETLGIFNFFYKIEKTACCRRLDFEVISSFTFILKAAKALNYGSLFKIVFLYFLFCTAKD